MQHVQRYVSPPKRLFLGQAVVQGDDVRPAWQKHQHATSVAAPRVVLHYVHDQSLDQQLIDLWLEQVHVSNDVVKL